jgi:hypothetical protein
MRPRIGSGPPARRPAGPLAAARGGGSGARVTWGGVDVAPPPPPASPAPGEWVWVGPAHPDAGRRADGAGPRFGPGTLDAGGGYVPSRFDGPGPMGHGPTHVQVRRDPP